MENPLVHGDLHAGNVKKAIYEYRGTILKKICAESDHHFNIIIQNIAQARSKLRDAVRDCLFCGELSTKGHEAYLHHDFVSSMACGLPINDS